MRKRRLTDLGAIRLALLYAIEWEQSAIGSYLEQRERWSPELQERLPLDAGTQEMISEWRRNIKAFKRVLDRHFNGARLPVPDGKPVPLSEILAAGPREFKGKSRIPRY